MKQLFKIKRKSELSKFSVLEKKQMNKIFGGTNPIQVDQSKLDGVLNLIR